MLISPRTFEALAKAQRGEQIRWFENQRMVSSLNTTPARVRLGNTLIAAGRRLGGTPAGYQGRQTTLRHA